MTRQAYLFPTKKMLRNFKANGYEIHGGAGEGTVLYPRGISLALEYKKPGLFSPPRILIWPFEEAEVQKTEAIARKYTHDVRRLPSDIPRNSWATPGQVSASDTVGRFFDRIYEELGKHESPRWDEIARTLGPD